MSVDAQAMAVEHKNKYRPRNRSEWEIVGGLRDGDVYEEKPRKFDGYLHKKRNPPLKGWHRRYFVLEEGILVYSKTPNDHIKGRHHGKIDVALSVLSYNSRKKKIDIDAEDFVCHIRTKNIKWFEEWVQNLRNHRLYRQNELNYGSSETPTLNQMRSEEEVVAKPVLSATGTPFVSSENLKRIRAGSLRSSSLQSQGKVLAWLIDNDSSEQCERDLREVNDQIVELNSMLEKLETSLPLAFHNSGNELSPHIGTDSHKRGSISKILSFKSSHKRERKLAESANGKSSASNPSLATKFSIGESEKHERPNSLGIYREPVQELKLCSEFVNTGQKVQTLLKNLSKRLGTERDRLKHALHDSTLVQGGNQPSNDVYIYSLKQCLQETQKQNEELKARLVKTGDMVVTENILDGFNKISLPPSPILEKRNSLLRNNINRSHSLSSKASEMFYDAEEGDDVVSTVSSDSSSSSFSDHDMEAGLSEEILVDDRHSPMSDMYKTGRRSTLPAPMSSNDTGLFSILTKNIGKDLTRISMPVTLNEPLNTLQILCEELEYSELLDKAASFSDPYERMIYMAAFAVSSYASTNTRAATKPFNPILGETYECIRLDKGWKFIAEQVSHHPPVSVCHADSQNFIFKQDCRVKTKFWGKSMEIHPIGGVSVEIPRFNETYNWKKVTTCVHNVLGGQRWVDQYGEMNITCNTITCKLTFVKASYWSDKKHEVHGTISGPDGKVGIYLFGKWTEGLYCKTEEHPNRCIWRAGNMPEDCDIYYGFTRFAIELNELREEEVSYLPITDTRFRPDQRMLEEGKVDEAEAEKHRVEKLQREARKVRETSGVEYAPRWFRKVEHLKPETYTFTDEYWQRKRDPGFNALDNIPRLW